MEKFYQYLLQLFYGTRYQDTSQARMFGRSEKVGPKGALISKKDLDWYPTGVRYTAWSCSKADKYTIQALMRWGTFDNVCFAMRSIKIQS